MRIQQNLFNLLVSLTLLLISVGCSKSDDDKSIEINEALNGTWDVTSWKINGVEAYNPALSNSFYMIYAKNSPTEGKYTWAFWIGFPFVIIENYKIEDNGKTFVRVLTGDKYTISIKNNILYLKSFTKTDIWDITAKKN